MPTARVLHGDCRDVLVDLLFEDFQADAVVCDPPYHLASIVKRFGKAGSAPAQFGKDGAFARMSRGFMGKVWDGGNIAADPETWKRVYEVMKPGAHLLAFGGTRTYHRMICAIEDAGFEIRDCIMWMYGQGMPKSHDVSKEIDKRAGAEREIIGSKIGQPGYSLKANDTDAHSRRAYGQFTNAEAECAITASATDDARRWAGWGTNLKPAWEPICVARKPLAGTVAGNVLIHGTGALNIEASRVPVDAQADARDIGRTINRNVRERDDGYGMNRHAADVVESVVRPEGRWPANVIHDGSTEVMEAFGESKSAAHVRHNGAFKSVAKGTETPNDTFGFYDTGSAARFFYCAKAATSERGGSKHPTVKPLALMQYLCKLVCPPDGTILDPFAGSGSTGEAAILEGFNAVLIENEAEYINDIRKRLDRVKEWM